MKRLARRLARLYPRWWRERYGGEFEVLLEDTRLRCSDVLNVLMSALEMRMSSTYQPRIVSMASRDVPGGYEVESAVEFPREDGSSMLVRNFSREIDLGDSYVQLRHWSRGDAPAETVLVFGKKDEVDGEFRTDETEMLVLEADGTVRHTEQTVKTSLRYDAIRDLLREKYRAGLAAGLMPDEIHRRIRAEGSIEL